MPRIETRTIDTRQRTTRKAKTSVGSGKTNSHRQHVAREQREKHQWTYGGGVTHCSRCPPDRGPRMPRQFCADCASINKARFNAGLIRPTGDPRPSPDNIINPTVVGKYRGPGFHKRFKDSPQPVVTAYVEKISRGWRRGVASLNGVKVHIGPKVQSLDAAWEFATDSAKLIKLALEFEHQLAEKYGEI